MTTSRRDGCDSPFSDWVRKHPELDSHGSRLSVTDSDLWCHRFSLRNERRRSEATDVRDAVDCIMLVECKSFSASVRYAQRDTLTVIDALLRLACTTPSGRRRHVPIRDGRLQNRVDRMVRCFGVHLLELSADRPDNSDQILWDKRHLLTELELVEVLRFDRDPDSPSRILDTRRHHRIRPLQAELKLVHG